MSADRPNFAKITEDIIRERTPSSTDVIYEPTIEFLDPDGKLTREERGKVIALGDRTAISYRNLSEKVILERNKPLQEVDNEAVDATVAFYLLYALAARSSNEISHTSILEQLNPGPDIFGGDPPIIMEGISILAGLRDQASIRHAGHEAFSTRGGIFPENYYRIPRELYEAGVGRELEEINRENYQIYLQLTRRGIEYYLQNVSKKESEKNFQYRWRVLSYALDDARNITNGTYLNHLSTHFNSALALREVISKHAANPLSETRWIADQLRNLGKLGLPNLMRHTEASKFTLSLGKKREDILKRMKLNRNYVDRGPAGSGIMDANITPDAEKVFVAAFLARASGPDFSQVIKLVEKMKSPELDQVITEIFEGITLHDKPPEELELVQINANMKITLGAFYELVRHRLATHVSSEFNPNRGYSVPESYDHMGLREEYVHGIELNERAYDLVSGLGENYRQEYGPYFVARGHIISTKMRISGLDVFHLLKLRASDSAHPDIRGPMFQLETYLRNAAPELFKHLVKKG